MGNDGIAVKTGGGLAVLDFDNAGLYDEFIASFPMMKDTMINLSGGKQLPHVYFRYPEDIVLRTRHLPELDLQAEGAYIVTNPTEAHGLKYMRLHGDESDIIQLTRIQLEDILNFLDDLTPEQQAQEIITVGQYIDDLVGLYYTLRDIHGSRNIGYFYALLQAQASGQRQECIDTVRLVFIQDTTNGYESEHSRYAEALRIEASALGYRVSGAKAIPLTFAERLCYERYELGGQLLYGLWSLGYGGQTMSVAQIAESVKPIIPVAISSIYSGISLLPDIAGLLPSYTSQYTMYRGSNFVKYNQKFHYIPEKPDEVELMPLWALSSGKNFRVGMMLELISYHPGTYSKEQLSKRTGLSVSTVKRILRTLRTTGMIEAQERVDVTPLNLQNWKSVMQSVTGKRWGIWLQDETEKMYPPILELAIRLITDGRQVSLMKMRPNFYQVKDSENS